ncbi:MAG TPA: ATP-binding cassette domain-containing protein [Candidatus Azoamicus sp.]
MKNMKLEAFFYKKLNKFTLNVTMNINDTKIITILGESGSGKTTLLNSISGLIIPDKSFLKINDKTFQNSKKDIFIKTNKRKIGYIRQNPILFSNLSVYENICIGKSEKYKDITNLINILQLNKILKRKITNLSGGEKQRVMIMQILVTNPDIILLDEPLSNQDENAKKIIIKYIKHLNEKYKIPIICLSHNIKELELISKKTLYLTKGKIIYSNF